MTFEEFREHVLKLLAGHGEHIEGIEVFIYPTPIRFQEFLAQEPWARHVIKESGDPEIWFAFADYTEESLGSHCRYILVADQGKKLVTNLNAHFPPKLLPEMQKVV